jgi:hypothetical protein
LRSLSQAVGEGGQIGEACPVKVKRKEREKIAASRNRIEERGLSPESTTISTWLDLLFITVGIVLADGQTAD